MRVKRTLLLLVLVLMATTPIFAGAESKKDVKFSDLPPTESHYDAVMSLVESGAITGYEDGTFRPYREISRQHVAVILSRELDLPVPKNIKQVLSMYDDVDVNHLYAKEIASVTDANIFKGSNGEFKPNKNITREQLATVFNRGFDLEKFDVDKVKINMKDVDLSHKESVQVIANLGLTNQLDYYDPRGNLKRGQFASFLYRTLDVLENEKPYEPEQPRESDESEFDRIYFQDISSTIELYEGSTVIIELLGDLKNNGGTLVLTDKATLNVSNKNIASINNGELTAIKAGETVVTATYKDFKVDFNVKVKKAQEDQNTLKFYGFSKTMYLGDEQGYRVTYGHKDGGVVEPIEDDSLLTYKLSDPSVISISNGKIKALKEGSTSVTITYIDYSVTETITVIDELDELKGYVLALDFDYETEKEWDNLESIKYMVSQNIEFGWIKSSLNEVMQAMEETYKTGKPVVLKNSAYHYDKTKKIMRMRYVTNEDMNENH